MFSDAEAFLYFLYKEWKCTVILNSCWIISLCVLSFLKRIQKNTHTFIYSKLLLSLFIQTFKLFLPSFFLFNLHCEDKWRSPWTVTRRGQNPPFSFFSFLFTPNPFWIHVWLRSDKKEGFYIMWHNGESTETWENRTHIILCQPLTGKQLITLKNFPSNTLRVNSYGNSCLGAFNFGEEENRSFAECEDVWRKCTHEIFLQYIRVIFQTLIYWTEGDQRRMKNMAKMYFGKFHSQVSDIVQLINNSMRLIQIT